MITTKKEKVKIKSDGHVTSPKGYKAGGVHCGIRKKRLDFGWIHSEVPATAAGVYTLNTFQAAPLKVTKESLEKEMKIQSVIVNSGNANSCTGEQGLKDALEMQKLAAEKFAVQKDYVAVASTGIIGVPLEMEKIKKGIAAINDGLNEDPVNFEEAILTTDTVTKQVAVELEIDGKLITIGGAAKGSGMIHPNMATMLAFITTDAAVEAESLQSALRQTTNQSFNMITVDGDSSTNDMVLLMANGKQDNIPLHEAHPEWNVFLEGLQIVSEHLAKQIARDGEGATKLLEVTVKGAPTDIAARQVAKAVISSNLVKTAVYGADPNWGRIVCAVGYSEQPIDPDKVSVAIGDIAVVKNGLALPFNEDDAKQYMQNEYVQLTVELNNGLHEATAWGCDLTYDYVRINASYRT
ncbi:bifunctional ornithine acetyltransferase/N-acetylglutamate synthase [Oceanobacillus piezotolerans]|uniref:Arginine biosynthesis bifunctional protein ArgJ n=1 Tax=Oceanobacillus piezotolerans TaxID=2448030 RepID=A0A498D5I9_9BACI|nr:bifunctional ornithine acetyltransferase/N-acetylglutamate synthase [Oceanobacillus piezotolerans]RLL44949.1 bifunctional ornithine acetyltransferase/N-acetylglutamate synthase [Oceanobacillus piezotolerans]